MGDTRAAFPRLLVVVLLLAAATPAAGVDSHDFQKIGCTYCHLSVPGQSNVINKLVFRRPVSELCLTCHEDSRANSVNHRIGILPSMKVPIDLRLGDRGELTCITCHMPHLPKTDRRSGARTYFLRRSILKRELCLACHFEDKFAEPTSMFRILAPIDNSIVKTIPIPFIGTVSDDLVSEATLYVNGLPVRLAIKNRTFSTLLNLQEGINNLKLEAKKSKTVTMNILYNPDLPEDLTYKLYYSHGILKKKDCRVCHEDESTTSITLPDRVLCAKCHDDKKFDGKFLHGPVAVGSCTSCHDPHGQTNRFFLVSKGEKLCFNCHSEKQVVVHFMEKLAQVGVSAARGCLNCHDPHQSAQKYLLKGN
jgi:predicted CXXCH cytochrome family protein